MCVALVLSTASATALIIDNGDNTLDTDTNLEWLDLTLTAGMTAADALVANPGYSVATRSQVEVLYTNAGFATLLGTWNTDNAVATELLLNLMGCTQDCGGNFPVMTGRVAVGAPNPLYGLIGQRSGPSIDVFRGYSRLQNEAASTNPGNYLIRTVPEPGTALLLGLGAFALGRRRGVRH